MKKYIRLYYLFWRFSLIRAMEYRFDFLFRAIPTLLSLLIGVLAINFIYSQIREIAGWKKNELYLLLGTYNIVWGIFFGLFIHNMSEINKYINRGELDLFLIKPLNSQFYVSVRNQIDFGEGCTLIFGMILVAYALVNLGISPGLLDIFLYFLLIINAVVTAYALWFINMITSFWVGRIRDLHEAFISIFNITKYPVEIFQGFLRNLFFYFIPLAVLVAFPTRVILNTLTPSFIIWSFLASAFFLFLSNRFWKFGLRRYSSASS